MARTPVEEVARERIFAVRLTDGEMKLLDDLAKRKKRSKADILREHMLILVNEALEYSMGNKTEQQAIDAVTNSATTIITSTPVSDEALKSRTQRQLDLWRAGAGNET